ncbi:hypothetical protein K4K57_001078 [Colletotrichum sp. SAR 10_99]|nr:hypothetical protein K4K55_004914 [Colletotrichum sp. SAR 10_96]KAJ5014769.1 hypothetical protein K4K57_001078 [Colletotrichum sp. SAR 10_99]
MEVDDDDSMHLNANEAKGNRAPVKIDLPEDDVKSMCFIFRAIYHHFDAFHNAKDIPFFEILIAADKYDLIHAIKHAFHHALAAAFGKEDILKKMLGVKLWKFTMAAAFVKDITVFNTATRIFVLHWEYGFLDFAKEWYFDEVFAFHVCVDDDASIVSDDTNAINNIAPDGDVIMVIGPKGKEFRLHSQILKAAFKVFKAMLGLNFAEGQQLLNNRIHNDPVKINLPEDDAYSMGTLFELIHYRHDVLSSADADIVFDVALAADKYDLIRAVKYPITEAMDRIVFTDDERGEEESMWKLAIAASMFDYDPSFKKATQALVLLSLDGYIRLANLWYQDQIFALRLCGLLEDQRAELRRMVMSKLLAVCAWYNDEDNDQTQRTFGSTILIFDIKMDAPEYFAHSDLSAILDAIESSDYFNRFRENARREDDRSTKWMGKILEKAGLHLSKVRA